MILKSLPTVLFVVALIATFVQPVSAKPTSHFSVQLTNATGQPASGLPVTVTNDQMQVQITTDAKGIADFKDLAVGEWTVDACGQTATVESVSGADGSLLSVTCPSVLLPVIFAALQAHNSPSACNFTVTRYGKNTMTELFVTHKIDQDTLTAYWTDYGTAKSKVVYHGYAYIGTNVTGAYVSNQAGVTIC